LVCGNCAKSVSREFAATSALQAETVRKAEQSPDVQHVLGSPVKRAGEVRTHGYQNMNGVARYAFTATLEGPNGKAELDCVATHPPGQEWTYERLVVKPERGEPIDLTE
jgi:hypothetical protein